MSEELKPCPLCGNPDIGIWESEEVFDDYHAFCWCCDEVGEHCATPEEAIDAWNKRASSPIYGQWIRYEDEDTNTWECSECHNVQQLMNGTPFENNWHYCPSCGAKMEQESE